MLTVRYQFYVLPRRHEHFRHAWLAAQDTLRGFLGLVQCRLREPEQRERPFTMEFDWCHQAGFERFKRTWLGVWLINGMGLSPEDFLRPPCREQSPGELSEHIDTR